MIPSLDTHVYRKIKDILGVILEREYMLDNALAQVDTDTRENFKKTYGGRNPKRQIEVSYEYPQYKQQFDARIVVELGEGQETGGSIGGVEDTYEVRETFSKHDISTVKALDDNHLVIEVSETIAELNSIPEISFASSDNVQYIDNKVIFNRKGNEHLIGLTTTVHYIEKGNEEFLGIKQGYLSTETVQVTPLSTNMDTARCMDMLLKVVMIIMRQEPAEQEMYSLQQHTFGDMTMFESLDADRLVFGRPLTIKYDVSNTVDFDFINELKTIIVRGGNIDGENYKEITTKIEKET